MVKKRIRVAVFDDEVWTKEVWIQSPRYRRITAEVVNRYFALGRDVGGSLGLIHIPTCWFAAHNLKNKSHGVRLVRALLRRYPAPKWNFTDPMHAKQLKGCKEIIEQFEAFA